MEKLTGKPNKENRSSAAGALQAEADSPAPAAGGAAEMSRAGSITQNSKHKKTVGFTEECTEEMERPSGTERDSPAASEPAVLQQDSPNSRPLAVPMSTNSPEMSMLELNPQCSDTATLDMDCMICFNKYSIYRVPKLLDCQHTFCAVCLKLILRKEENTWIITCPLCRKPTLVSGGLIRTLQDKEDVLERLESLDSNPEVYVCAVGLDGNSWTQSSQDILITEENSPAHTSLAVQRLVLLLLLGVILAMLILPFMYSGRVKWVICLLLTLGLLMSLMLCCTPKFHCRCKKDSPASCDKEIQVVTVA
ncbi:E3 ubiquitin-protein ligase RNF186 [Oenanthe melanoleuca]|uniref:E3 ubiquitin-protein ligase RNF186 n=1 Tax=Oenanthe melanoleuca TaxID=2939378 RepID=UPI0024C148A0|nr:E3 ubiquitin-protein ligase RNF186 [Oenanthe melanoleuca]